MDFLRREKENAANASRIDREERLRLEAENEDLRRTVRQLRAQVGSVWDELGWGGMVWSRCTSFRYCLRIEV